MGTLFPCSHKIWGTWEQYSRVPRVFGELFTNIGEHVHQLTGFKVSVVNN